MMAENKWVVDGHHFTCPDCKKTIAIVVNESDEDFEFCPFCGKRMSGQMAENKMEQVAAMFGKKLGEEFFVKHPKQTEPFLAQFEDNGVWYICSYDGSAEWHYSETLLVQLLTGEAVIVDD